MKSIVLRVLVILVIGFVLMFLFDLLSMSRGTKPLIVIDEFSYEYEEAIYTEYTSLGYKIVIKEIGFIKEGSLHSVFEETKPDDLTFIVRDKTGDICPAGELMFYEDEHFEYYFNCKKNVYIEIDREEYPISDALKDGLVTIKDLEDKVNFEAEVKVDFSFETYRDDCNEFSGEVEYLKNPKDGLYIYCLERANVYVNRDFYSFAEVYGNELKLDSLIVGLNKGITYDDGSVMYSDGVNQLLVCDNGDVVLGPEEMAYYDILCK